MLKKEREQISFIQKELSIKKGEYAIELGWNSYFYFWACRGETRKRVDPFWYKVPKELWFDNFYFLENDLPYKYGNYLSVFLCKLSPETILDKEEWQHLTFKEIFDSLDTVKRLNGERT